MVANNDEGDFDDIDKMNILENIDIDDENDDDVYSFGGKAEVTEGSAGWTASQAGSQGDDVNYDDVDDDYCDDEDDNHDHVNDDAIFSNPIHSVEYV